MQGNNEMIIDLEKVADNIKKLKLFYNDYDCFFANVKNNFFGLGLKAINTLVSAGVNYLYTSTLEEALEIRKINHEIPILISFYFNLDDIYDAINNNISITIEAIGKLKEITKLKIKDKINIHLLLDNGSNKRGLRTATELKFALDIIKKNSYLNLEGIYTEFENYGITDHNYYLEMAKFKEIIAKITPTNIIIHGNEPLMYHEKDKLINGLDLSLAILGIKEHIANNIANNLKIKKNLKNNDLIIPKLKLDLVFQIKTKIVGVTAALKKDVIGKNYLANHDMLLAVIPLGHKDGFTKAILNVEINKNMYPVIADQIDYMLVEIDEQVRLNDDVYIIKDNIYPLIKLLNTNRFYLMSILNKDLKRVYLNENKGDNIL